MDLSELGLPEGALLAPGCSVTKPAICGTPANYTEDGIAAAQKRDNHGFAQWMEWSEDK